MSPPNIATRRHFIRHASGLTALAAAPMVAVPARAAARGERRLSLLHLHTGERLTLAFARDERYTPEALAALNRLLRDHYSGDVTSIDPRLFDLLHGMQRELGHEGAFEIVSAYRAPATNARLARIGGGGVARHSLHMEGRALDLRLPGVALADLRNAALDARQGGVGFYAREQFVHVDTGRVRAW
jgi:uncharacterized protein YcbK (DUF882 family)